MSQVYLHTSYKRPPGNLWIPTLAPQIVATSRKGFHAIHGVGSKPQLSWHYLGPSIFRWTNRNMEKWLGGCWKNPGPMWSWVNFWIKGEWFWQDWGISLHEFCPSKGGMVSMRFVNQGEWFWQNLTHWYVLCMFLLTRKFINKTVKRHGVYRRCDYSHLEHCIQFRNSRTQDVEHLQSKGRAKRSYFHRFRAWAMGGRLGPTQ